MSVGLALPRRLDAKTAPAWLQAACAASPGNLVIDLSDCELIGACGLEALLVARAAATRSGHDFVLKNITEGVRDQLELLGMPAESLTVEDTE